MTISDEAIELAVLASGNRFDSHDVIRKIAQQNQQAYIGELGMVASDTPFQTLHSMLGKRIKVVCERHGFIGEASRSLDVFGQDSNCVYWSRPSEEPGSSSIVLKITVSPAHSYEEFTARMNDIELWQRYQMRRMS